MKKILIAILAISGVALAWATPPLDRLPELLVPPTEAHITNVILSGSVPVGGSNPSFTYVNSNASTDSNTVELTGVTAGHLIAVFFTGSYLSPPTNITCSDGTSSLTKANLSNGTYQVAQWFYILSSVASGTVTYTISDTDGAYVFMAVYEFSYTGTISLDQQNAASADVSTSINTGSVTTTGGSNSQLMLAGHGSYGGGTTSSHSIAGTAGSGVIISGSGPGSSWYRIVTENTNGAGTATDSESGYWAAQMITFK